MKPTKSIITVLFVLLTAQMASAYYCPSTGRWLSRDPMGEPGFENLLSGGTTPTPMSQARWIKRDSAAAKQDPNRYAFIGNNPISQIDAKGLRIWVCTIPTSGFPLNGCGRHAYLWDDRKATADKDRECGMESAYGYGISGNGSGNYGPVDPDSNDQGPWTGNGEKGTAECYPVDDSAGNENAVMSCCSKTANNGPFLPYVHDCHSAVDSCLKANNLNIPPHSRGDPISNHIKDIQCCCRE